MQSLTHAVFLIFTILIIVGHSRFVPDKKKVHFGPGLNPRQWGRWCSSDMECGNGFCQAYMCQCYRGYISWRYMEVCNYEQRTKSTAFLLSFFVGIFGVDWFVLSRGNAGYIVAGFIKLIISLGCIIAWPALITNISRKDTNLPVIVKTVGVLLSLISFIWWLTDWIRVLADVFYDGNRAPLKPWGYDYYSTWPYRGYK